MRPYRDSRRGSVLVIVLVFIGLMTVGGMAYFDWTFLEHRATETYARQVQARAAADSAIELTKTYLLEAPQIIQQQGGLVENPLWFQGIPLSESPAAALQLQVSVVSPRVEVGDFAGYRFGLENESARINLNTLLLWDEYAEDGARLQLLALPGMTEAIADAILDWLDEDSEPRALGAESQYYLSLDAPYAPQNGPLESLDQLLMVRDVTPALLYGLDRDRNFVLSETELAGGPPAGVDNSTGAMNRGWSAYLTLYSAEANLTSEGEQKIDVNMEDLEELHGQLESALGREQANFIVAYRQGGEADESGSSAAVSAATITIDFDQAGSETIPSLLALIGVQVEFSDNGAPTVLRCPFPDNAGAMVGYLPDMLDKLTVSSSASMPGRLNINQAPRTLLYGVPNLPPEVVEQLIASRDFEPTLDRPERRHAEWLLMEGLLTLEEMKELAPLVTGGGDVYRGQFVGYYGEEGPTTRIEAVIDDTGTIPQVVHRMDLTPLGAGFAPVELSGQAQSVGIQR